MRFASNRERKTHPGITREGRDANTVVNEPINPIALSSVIRLNCLSLLLQHSGQVEEDLLVVAFTGPFPPVCRNNDDEFDDSETQLGFYKPPLLSRRFKESGSGWCWWSARRVVMGRKVIWTVA